MHTVRILLNRVFWRSFFLLRSFCNHGIQSGGFVNRKLVSEGFDQRSLVHKRYIHGNFVNKGLVSRGFGSRKLVSGGFVNRKFVNKSFIHGNFVNKGILSRGFGNRGLGSRGFVSRNFIRWGFGRERGIFCSCLRRFDQDFSADGILDDVHLLVFHEFEENEEGHDDLFLALLGFQKGAEFGPGVCLQISADIESLGIDVDFFAPDFSEPAPDRITSALFSAEDFSEDFFQLFQVSALEEILIVNRRLVGAHFFGKVLRTKITHACLLPADSELFGHIFIHLVFQKAPDQLFAGIAFLFTGLFVFFPGKEHAALDIQKGRRHDEKFTCDVHVLVIHLMDIFEVLVGDLDDRNIVDVYFVFLNQVHEQVQRTFEHRKLYGNCHN